MQFISNDINLNITGRRGIAFAFSLILIVISILSLIIHKGPNYGIDFSGGTLVQVKFSDRPEISDIRDGLNQIGLTNSSIQNFGPIEHNDFLIRTSISEMAGEGFSNAISEALKEATGIEPDIRRIEMVGPQVGKDLRKKALLAVFYSLLFIAIYISGRFEMKWILSGVTAGALMTAVYFLSIFNMSMVILIAVAIAVTLVLFWYLKLKYALGAVVSLIHDVIITVGVFSILNLEFSLTIIAALLTIIGYSLNDTIIVFDRIRENIKQMHKSDLETIINRSINETLSRTLLTSLTTLIVLFSLYFLGGEIIHDFAFSMIFGVIIGTYSSIFIASPILLAWGKRS
ncbi:MAG: protein translocase subunit SecF [Desulfobacterium sp.]|jgi:preprotein translocase subunit SecF|nr:protein translocase subunit SecF [Desulfobacterium sp.]